MSKTGVPNRLGWAIVLGFAALAVVPSLARGQLSDAQFQQLNEDLSRADQLQSQHKNDQAITLLEATYERVKRQGGPTSQGFGFVSTRLGFAYCDAGRYEKAEPLLRQAVVIGKALPGDDGSFRHNALNALVAALIKRSKFEEAEKLGRQSLQDLEKLHGPNDDRTSRARDTLCQLYVTMDRPADAIPLARISLKQVEAQIGAKNPETIRYRLTLGVALTKTGDYREAKSVLEASMAIAKTLPPADDRRTASQNALKNVEQMMGQVGDAVQKAREQFEGVKARPDAKLGDIVEAWNGLALAYQSDSRFAEAEKEFKEALAFCRSKLDPDHEQTAILLANYASLLVGLGRFAEAESLVEESIKIDIQVFGPGSLGEAKGYVTQAGIYAKTNRVADAEVLLEKARVIMEVKLPPDHPDLLSLKQNRASLPSPKKDLTKTIEELMAAIHARKERDGRYNRFTAIMLVNLGQAYIGQGNFRLAEENLRLALEILERELGPAASDTAYATNALGGLYMITRRFSDGEKLFRRTVEICRTTLGPDHPSTGSALDNLATLLAMSGRYPEAITEVDRSRKARRNFLTKTLPSLSRDDQITLLDLEERTSLNQALSLAVKRQDDPEVAAKSAEWVFNSKAFTLRALAQASVLARDSANAEARKLLDQLNMTRAKLARINMARDNEGLQTAQIRVQRQALDQQEQEQARKLGLELGRPVEEPWLPLSELRESIPADAVVVEFSKFAVYDFDVKLGRQTFQPARYAAWVIPPSSPKNPAMIDLGLASTIEQAIEQSIASIQAAPDAIRKPGDEPAGEKKSMVPLQTLADLLYKPLEDYLKPAKRWVFSPDAALWLVPWSALPVKAGRYAIEDHLIHLAVSGRDVSSSKTTTHVKVNAPAILADPDYDIQPGEALSIAKGKGRIVLASRGEAPLGKKSAFGFLNKEFPRLLGVQAEAKAVAPLLSRFANSNDVELLVGAEASETVFKALRSPKVLLVSTHGFFIGGPDPLIEKAPSQRPERSLRAINPFLRCGLILAGCNSRRDVPEAGDDDDDGILTGLEVIGSDLRGTELVVLSACETGLGQVRDGEGVAGLRQSFQIAGAGSVVATLWRIPDDESYQIVSMMFESMVKKHGPAASLREAQLAMIGDRRERNGAAHPAFWAAFSLTGFPGANWRVEPVIDAGSPDLPKLPLSLADAFFGKAIGAISPMTGQPISTNPWPDALLSVVLITGGGFLTRWWWHRGGVSL